MGRLNRSPLFYVQENALRFVSTFNVAMTISNTHAIFAMLNLMERGNGTTKTP